MLVVCHFFGLVKLSVFAVLLTWCSQVMATDCVILLHGLARSENSMSELAEKLADANFVVVNRGYPSRDATIETLADETIPAAVAECPPERNVSFVTHSMGGILVRQYLSVYELPRLRRVVMLGPPNQGSEVVDKLAKVPGFHFINGEAGMQLGTGELSVPGQLGAAHYDVGIIAGTRSINWILSSLIPGKDDGKVAIERTKLEGMNDHITMPVTHPMMMNNNRVIEQVIYYLQHGQFRRVETAEK